MMDISEGVSSVNSLLSSTFGVGLWVFIGAALYFAREANSLTKDLSQVSKDISRIKDEMSNDFVKKDVFNVKFENIENRVSRLEEYVWPNKK